VNPAKNQLLEEGILWCEVRKRERRGYFGRMGTNEEVRRYYVPSARVTGQKLWQNQLELHRLKYASPLLRAPACFKRYNTLACRVTSR
jgi:hypothetical protein